MKRKNGYIILLFCIFLCAAMLPVRAKAAEPTVTAIGAVYTGDTLVVGEEIPKDKISVTAYYSDGTSAEVTEFAMSMQRVAADGANRIMIVYRGKSTEVYVYGKKPSSLYAFYTGELVSVGNRVGSENLDVSLYYSDGSYEKLEDYQVANPVITAVGTQKVRIIYGSLNTTVDVIGIASKPISMLTAVYDGEGVPQGTQIPESNMYVTALYTDGTTERIYNYTVVPATVENLGDNKMYASYGGKTAEFTVKGIELVVESITVSYSGGSVEVGDYVDEKDVTVTAAYNNGTKAKVTDFTLLFSRITVTGENTVNVMYGGQRASFKVTGVASTKTNFTNAAAFTVKNTVRSAKVQVSLPKKLEKTAVTGKSLKPDRVAGVVGKLKTEVIDYIAFDLVLEDETQDDIFPLSVRIELPSYYKKDQTFLYFTSNRKSVIARMNTSYTTENVMEATVFRTGTYILVYEQEPKEDETEAEDDYLD